MQAIYIAIAASLLASTAYANDVDPNGFEKQHFVTSASRADVVADLKAAQKQGLISVGELGAKVVAEPSSKSRDQVAAEARAAKHVYGEVGDISE